MVKKIIGLFIICFSAVVLMASFISSDFKGGQISKSEKRYLATFPAIDSDNFDFGKFTKDFESWLSDNIGFRTSYNKVHKYVSCKVLKLYPDRVHRGKDGWLFITDDNNIKIATDSYSMSKKDLEKFAGYHQNISDYYKKLGKAYYLLLLPSKASVYPENIIGNYGVSETNVDIIQKYMEENTDVNVINPKKELIEAKNNGDSALYYKTDTHWNSLGSYIVYNAIMKRMLEDGNIEAIRDFSPEIVEDSETRRCDLSDMVGADIVPAENTVTAHWNKTFYEDKESNTYTRFIAHLDYMIKTGIVRNPSRDEYRFVNDNSFVNNKNLLIYSDSMCGRHWQLGEYFAENFKNVNILRISKPDTRFDDILDTDIVIYERYERLIEDVCKNISVNEFTEPVNDILNDLTKLPPQNTDRGINGLAIDKNSKEYSVEGNTIKLNKEYEEIHISGWAIDSENECNLGDLYLEADNNLYRCNYGFNSPDLVSATNIEGFDKARFSFNISRTFLEEKNADKVKFYMLSSDDRHYYEPVEFNIAIE